MELDVMVELLKASGWHVEPGTPVEGYTMRKGNEFISIPGDAWVNRQECLDRLHDVLRREA